MNTIADIPEVPPAGSLLRRAGVVFLFYLVASLALTWPLGIQFAAEQPVGGDSWQNIWNLWWTRQAMTQPEYSLLFCPLIFYPHGLSLALHSNSWLNTLLAQPFLGLCSLEAMHYFQLWIYFPISALAAWLLARRYIRSPLACFMAGWIYAYSPYRTGRYIIEQIDIVATAFIPLFILFLLEFMDRPRWKAALAAALFLFLQTFSSWYNGAFCALFAAFAFLYRWFTTGLPRKPSFWMQLAAVFLLPVVLLSPLILPMLRDLGEPLFATHTHQVRVSKDTSSDLLALVTPGVLYPTFLQQATGWHGPAPGSWTEAISTRILKDRKNNILEATSYVGWTVLALAAWAVVLLLKKRTAPEVRKLLIFWLTAALVFAILCLGPVLQIAGWESPIPLPYALINALPGFSVLRAPVRLSILLTLALGVTAAFVLDHWLKNGKQRLALLFSVLIALDLAMLPLSRLWQAHPIPEIYTTAIAEDETPGTVLEIPTGYTFPSSWYNVRGMYYQTRHGRPLLVGYISRTPEDPYHMLEKHPLLKAVSYRNLQEGARAVRVPLKEAAADMQELDIRYIVLHLPDILDLTGGSAESIPRLKGIFSGLCGPPIQEDGRTMTFRYAPEREITGEDPPPGAIIKN